MSETTASNREIRSVALIGLGTIGVRWAAAFAHAGLDVRAYDPSARAFRQLQDALPALLADLDAAGFPRGKTLGEIVNAPDLESAVGGCDFVQENAPEDLDLKRRLMVEIDAAARVETVISSSSSALFVSDFQAGCAHPERVVLGHPFNPAHLMPLVEVVGGRQTADFAVETAVSLYERIGKKPVVLRGELVGHLALRLMGGMWREAIALMAAGVVTASDVDRAFRYGPGPKWTLQGSFISNHLGADGIAGFLQKYGGTYEAIWRDLRPSPALDAATQRLIVEQTEALTNGQPVSQLVATRDAALIELLRLMHRFENGA